MVSFYGGVKCIKYGDGIIWSLLYHNKDYNTNDYNRYQSDKSNDLSPFIMVSIRLITMVIVNSI